MDLKKLMKMSVASRTDFLERVAAKQGLFTAPGVRTESELLGAILPPPPGKGRSNDFHTKTLFAHYFKAPLLLARLLQLFHPHLLEARQRRLRVLYLGAAREETIDNGRWFRIIWTALGLSQQHLEITAVGPELAMRHTWEPSDWEDMVEELPPIVTEHIGTFGEFFSRSGFAPDWGRHFDIVVMHHPGFVAHCYDWLHDDCWQELAAFGDVPIVGTSFDATDFAFDRNGLALSGLTVDRVYWNSSAHVAPGQDIENPKCTRLQWGGVVWSTKRDPYLREGAVSPDQASAGEWFARHGLLGLIGDPVARQAMPLLQHLFWYYTCPMQFDDMLSSIHVTDDIRIDAASGVVTAYGHVIPASELSRRITEEMSLDSRLSFLQPLLLEMLPHLNWRKVGAFTAARGHGAFPGARL